MLDIIFDDDAPLKSTLVVLAIVILVLDCEIHFEYIILFGVVNF